MNREFWTALKSAMEESPPLINRLLGTAALAVAFGYGIYHLDPIADRLASHLDSLQELKTAGLELSFSQESLDKHANLFSISDFKNGASATVAKDIDRLDASTLARLIYVGATLAPSCLYDTRRADVLQYVVTDYRLQELGLAKIEESDALKTDAERRTKSTELGKPLRCYTIDLTERGQNVRNVVVESFATSFFQRAPDAGAPPVTAAKSEPKTVSAPATPQPAANKGIGSTRNKLAALPN